MGDGIMRIGSTLAALVISITMPFYAWAQKGEQVDVHETLNSVKLVGAAPSRGSVLVVRMFDASEADLGTGEEGGKPKQVEAAAKMQQDAPVVLADEMVEEFAALDYFSSVRLDTGDALGPNDVVIEGRFTKLNPGSRAKRYLVGFGAGREVMEIEGAFKSSQGEVLAEFTQERISVMGVAGGDYQKKMASGMRLFADDVAMFIEAWTAD